MNLATPEQIHAYHRAAFGGEPDYCKATGEGWAVACMSADRLQLRPGEIISGPSVFSIADMALAFAVYTKIGIEPMALTSELSIRYMRPARGTELWARAEVHHAGRRSVIGTVVIWTDDESRPVAVAQGTYVRPVTDTAAVPAI